MKNWIIAAVWVVGIGVSWELVARATAPKDKDTQDVVTAVLISTTCPLMLEARRKAMSLLFWHALKKPHTMPPWYVAQILMIDAGSAQDPHNPIALTMCEAMVKS